MDLWLLMWVFYCVFREGTRNTGVVLRTLKCLCSDPTPIHKIFIQNMNCKILWWARLQYFYLLKHTFKDVFDTPDWKCSTPFPLIKNGCGLHLRGFLTGRRCCGSEILNVRSTNSEEKEEEEFY